MTAQKVEFDAAVVIDGRLDKVKVTGEVIRVKGFPDIQFVVHRTPLIAHPSFTTIPWTVSEVSTGHSIYQAATKEETVNRAKAYLTKRGYKSVRDRIASILARGERQP